MADHTSNPLSSNNAGKEITPVTNFIRNIVEEDLKNGKNGGRVHTRFPPEPNGYLHIGHAKSICLNFGLARDYNGKYNLRFDDTNPVKEEQEYVDSIKYDVRWLGFDWEDREYYASDYFDQLYDLAIVLIKAGKAYVDDQTADEIRETRGTLTQPGTDSPYRNRSVAENLDLFERMRDGEFPDGSKVLRAKIDMASPNINFRDPVMYRILHASHHRTGDKWNIYPMYDWAHGQSDAIEGITHSICTLEFEIHRPLYDWFLEQLDIGNPRQIEFARLSLSYTVMSKRKLLQLVQEQHVNGWDDPRMPTLSGMRRRGFTPKAIRDFCDAIGVTRADSMVEYEQLEYWVREDLNKIATRTMVVLDPIKLVIDNWPDDQVQWLTAENNPEDQEAGTRLVPFGKELFIERDDFMEIPAKKYFRLAPGMEVRLKHAYYVVCTGFKKDADGNVTEVHCTYDPATRGGWSDDGRKVKGTLHWVSAEHAIDAEVRLYDHLFTEVDPGNLPDGKSFLDAINPDSLRVVNAKAEPSLAEVNPGDHFQFLRHAYFSVDPDSKPGKPVYNRTVELKSSWKKIVKQS
ncbi:MAG: glutamine--tRNA ligase/YqeY domain fusion protein [Calditrichia bacterium]|nr:glutamine--tRNA ligase/YqeY domain fusion protein [Calditrichota bacterium]MCB0269228.1 glutamine--tRNA ligase/YqeY domain fusion protein [Calditrichota bacterium]MCB9068975.1 glutamine--tRNA ligase/YqeY domain fusion protein [Calditrichia bacterium]